MSSTVYEYHKFRCLNDHAAAELNRLGANGWRLVPHSYEVASAHNPTTSRSDDFFSCLMERAWDKAEVDKEKADAKAAADKVLADAKAAAKSTASEKAPATTFAPVIGAPVGVKP